MTLIEAVRERLEKMFTTHYGCDDIADCVLSDLKALINEIDESPQGDIRFRRDGMTIRHKEDGNA